MSNFEKEFNSGKNRKYRWIQWFAAVAIFGTICYFLPKPYNWILAVVVVVPTFVYLIYKDVTKKR